MDAIAETISAHGYSGVTVDRILDRSGVSRESFEALFASKDEALEETLAAAFERLLGVLKRACSAQSEWPMKVKVAIGAALDYAAADPAGAALLELRPLIADPRVARHATDARDQLALMLADGRRYTERGAELPALTEQAIVAGLMGVVSSRIGEAERLPALAPQLVQIALLPYLGAVDAARVATRPPPEL